MHDEGFTHEHADDLDGDHGHDDPHVDLRQAARLRSIGIDIGSSTSHFIISELYIGKRDPRMAGKPEVLERKILYRSPIRFTPYINETSIDAAELERFLVHHCAAAGLPLEDMDTGAIICTGEAARKENAAAISEQLSMKSGHFVCAVAGHHLEALLGVRGSGVIDASHAVPGDIIALDIGGGTAKRSVLSGGKVLHTAALNIGARLIAWDPASVVNHMDTAGAAVAKAIGIDVNVGQKLEEAQHKAIARRMAQCLIQFLGFEPMDALAQSLFLTVSAPPPLRPPYRLVFLGGVSEYFYGRETEPMGDLGLELSEAFRQLLREHVSPDQVLEWDNGIRATVTGAGQFTMQISSETVWLDPRFQLPLRSVPVYGVPLDWRNLDPASVEDLLSLVLQRREGEELCALSFTAAPSYGYGAVYQLVDALAHVLPRIGLQEGIVLVFRDNIARIAGGALDKLLPEVPVLCIDEVEVGDFEYLDIGAPPAGSAYVPVVVKSLVFS